MRRHDGACQYDEHVTTRADRARAMSLALAAAAASWLLTGCGVTTKTVTVSSVPPGRAPTVSQATTPSEQPSASTTSSPETPPGSTGTTTSSTRTAPEPQFEQAEGKPPAETPAGLAGPLAVLHAHGYVAVDTSQYHPDQTLQVLVGTRASAGTKAEQAFFFVDGHYLGTDAAQPSAQLNVVSQGDTEATLAYSLYRQGDPVCCPSGGQAHVRFQLNDGQLGATGTIPTTRVRR
jgi:LppP/LprE lipoprotein